MTNAFLRRLVAAILFLVAFTPATDLPGFQGDSPAIDPRESIDFDSQVIPVLTKLGCNSGACHGSAAGRGGFRLSLFGSRPQSDYLAIVRENKGRRINRFDHEMSLFLRKPGGELNHGGEQLFEFDDEAGAILSQWIEQGANRRDVSKLTRLEVRTADPVVSDLSKPVQIMVVAQFGDRNRIDVTRWTQFETRDDSAISVDEVTGLATILRRGRHIINARFMDRVVPIEIIAPLDRPEPDDSKVARHNLIDDFIYKKLKRLRIAPAGQASDPIFLRRVTLDLTGRLPTPRQIADFEKTAVDGNRGRYIESLIGSEAFQDYWTYLLAQQLRIRSQAADKKGVLVYHRWLRRQISENVGWNEIARRLMTASGDSHQVGPANFYRTTGNPRLQAEFVTESLLGIRLRCANCHDHPLDQWIQDDYHGLAAILAKTDQGRLIRQKSNAQVIHPATGQPAREKIPGGRFFGSPKNDSRKELANWLIDRDNPYFAKAMVNRIWAHLMGRGLIHPVDDLRATNPASHPDLLRKLEKEFIDHDYDLRHLIRLICESAAYQRKTSATTQEPLAEIFYAVAAVRELPAEIIADAIDDVTGVSQVYVNLPKGTRAVQIPDPANPANSLDILGRCARTDSCESAVGGGGQLSRQLHLLNGDLINQKLADRNSRLQRMIDDGKTTPEIVDEFYLRCLGHRPTRQQAAFWTRRLAAANVNEDPSARRKQLEDFVWSLLTCREFITNH